MGNLASPISNGMNSNNRGIGLFSNEFNTFVDAVSGAANFILGNTAQNPPVPELPAEFMINQTNANGQANGMGNARFGHTEESLKKLIRAPQPKRISTKMLDYQLQGLAWLLQHEHPHLHKNPQKSTQFWVARSDGSYFNRMTNQIGDPQLISGGILADDMGLGKTIQLLSLVCSDLSVAIEKGVIKRDTTPARYKNMPTLILAPVGLMSNWSGQAMFHVNRDHPLRVLVFYGTNKNPSVEFSHYDVVIASYGSVTSEYRELEQVNDPNNLKLVKRTPKNMRLFEQPWRRVILDEAHIIRNPAAKIANGVLKIDAYSRWALTGTPIMNSLTDLFSLVRFFRMHGLEERGTFESIITRGFQRRMTDSETRLQALMMEVCLRRLKTMDKIVNLNLPPLNEYLHTIEWTQSERQVYDAMEHEAQHVMQEYRDGSGSNSKTYIFLLEALLRLRQICNHKQLCGSRLKGTADIAGKSVLEPTHDNIIALQILLQAAVDADEECPICFEKLHNPRITLCKHIYGKECIQEVIIAQQKCPICRQGLTDPVSSLIAPMEETGGNDTVIDEKSSSKLEAIMKILVTQKLQNDAASNELPVKTVVFSQWTSFLDVIEPLLFEAGIKFARIDGKMSVSERDDSVKRLNDDREITVLLASLAVSSTGLNLTAASQIIMCDLWWNVAQERQAIDRCYRLGQTRPVNVFRLVMKDSIEQRVIKIQDDKVEIVERALNDGKRTVKSKEARLADIELLLTSDTHRARNQPAALANPPEQSEQQVVTVRSDADQATETDNDEDSDDVSNDDSDDDLDGFIVKDGAVDEGDNDYNDNEASTVKAGIPRIPSLGIDPRTAAKSNRSVSGQRQTEPVNKKKHGSESDSSIDSDEDDDYTAPYSDFLKRFAEKRRESAINADERR